MNSNKIFVPGNRFVVPFLAFLSAFAPISTDMYLPALPSMAQTLHAGNELVSYSISGFLLVFAISMLFWGPLSDKYGRKPILIAGSIFYIISSIAIALTDSIWSLLIWRGVQAIGSGAASAMALAIVKDIMRGERMEKLVGIMQAVSILAPVTAPMIGGAMLAFVNWRGIFWCLMACGGIALAGTLCLKETRYGKRENSLGATFMRISIVVRNRQFLFPWLLFSAMAMPFMSYLGVSTFIYQDEFGVSPQAYSLFFALNAGVSVGGPLLHMAILHNYSRNMVLLGHMIIMAIFGFLILLFGYIGPWIFAILFLPISLCGSGLRPPATVLMMQSHDGDNGIVTALINCGGLLFGSLSMFIATLPFWPNSVLAVGCIALGVSAICAIGWLLILKKSPPQANKSSILK